MPKFSCPKLIDALAFAAWKHRNQRRKDVDASPYINHPIALAHVLAVEAGVDDEHTLVAAILHDTLEDTETSFEELSERFGTPIAKTVAEVSDDISLPRLDGHALLEKTQPQEGKRRYPVVVLTGSRLQSDIERSFALHADEHISKPAGLLHLAAELTYAVRMLGLQPAEEGG